MRKVDYIVVHCTATQQNATVNAIQRYWRDVMRWISPGYHIIVEPDGDIVRLAEDDAICNGVQGYNSRSVHVSYVGGVDAAGKAKDNRTPEQKASILRVLQEWRKKYPKAVIQGHRDFPNVKKDCPSFNAKGEYWYV